MDYARINKQLWDKKTDIHAASEFYDVQGFVNGNDPLKPYELDLLGDVRGKSLLHLQCHFGMDTIALSRRGAKATGVDLSSKSIEQARALAATIGTDTRFIESDVLKLDQVLDEQFDIVFTSYGTIGWLPDIEQWSKVIARCLKPGGMFVFVDFHPAVWMMSYDFSKIEYEYDSTTPIIEELEGTYTDRNAQIKEQSISWNHGMLKVLQALIDQGLNLNGVKEYYESPYDCFQNTVEVRPGMFQIKGIEGKIPMVYSIQAYKQT